MEIFGKNASFTLRKRFTPVKCDFVERKRRCFFLSFFLSSWYFFLQRRGFFCVSKSFFFSSLISWFGCYNIWLFLFCSLSYYYCTFFCKIFPFLLKETKKNKKIIVEREKNCKLDDNKVKIVCFVYTKFITKWLENWSGYDAKAK